MPSIGALQWMIFAIQIIGSLIGLPALILAIVNHVLRNQSETRLQDLRNQNQLEITSLRAELDRVSNEAKTKFDWLHVERAKAIIELFGAIIELDMATGLLLTPGFTGPRDTHDQQAKDRWKGVNEAGRRYRILYPKHAIFFATKLSDKFRVLDDLYWAKYVTANVFGKFETRDDLEQWQRAMDHSDVGAIITQIKAALQELLGVPST